MPTVIGASYADAEHDSDTGYEAEARPINPFDPDYTGTPDIAITDTPASYAEEWGLYLHNRATWNERLHVNAGLRYGSIETGETSGTFTDATINADDDLDRRDRGARRARGRPGRSGCPASPGAPPRSRARHGRVDRYLPRRAPRHVGQGGAGDGPAGQFRCSILSWTGGATYRTGPAAALTLTGAVLLAALGLVLARRWLTLIAAGDAMVLARGLPVGAVPALSHHWRAPGVDDGCFVLPCRRSVRASEPSPEHD